MSYCVHAAEGAAPAKVSDTEEGHVVTMGRLWALLAALLRMQELPAGIAMSPGLTHAAAVACQAATKAFGAFLLFNLLAKSGGFRLMCKESIIRCFIAL